MSRRLVGDPGHRFFERPSLKRLGADLSAEGNSG